MFHVEHSNILKLEFLYCVKIIEGASTFGAEADLCLFEMFHVEHLGS